MKGMVARARRSPRHPNRAADGSRRPAREEALKLAVNAVSRAVRRNLRPEETTALRDWWDELGGLFAKEARLFEKLTVLQIGREDARTLADILRPILTAVEELDDRLCHAAGLCEPALDAAEKPKHLGAPRSASSAVARVLGVVPYSGAGNPRLQLFVVHGALQAVGRRPNHRPKAFQREMVQALCEDVAPALARITVGARKAFAWAALKHFTPDLNPSKATRRGT